MTTYGYFKMMEDIGKGWENARKVRLAEKQELINADDWDGVNAWNEREKQFPFPFPSGMMKVYWAWKNSENASIFTVDDLPWADGELKDFVDTIEEAGIEEFALVSQSTSLMNVLHGLEESGCKIIGLCKVTKTDNRFGENEVETLNGILVRGRR